jgi:hypothetical protein
MVQCLNSTAGHALTDPIYYYTYRSCASTADDDAAGVLGFVVLMLVLAVGSCVAMQKQKKKHATLFDKRKQGDATRGEGGVSRGGMRSGGGTYARLPQNVELKPF